MSNSISYKDAGVNINAGNESVNKIKKLVKETFNENVVTSLGTFGAMYDVSWLKDYNHPILVQSIDSVGTKIKVATMAGKHENIGRDMVGHACGDVLSQGARPLTFLDYIAINKVKPSHIEEVVSGIVKACKEVNISLIGGEVAELPGVYKANEYDLVGAIAGVVEKDKVITGKNIKKGDIVVGLESNGLHTNGYSLARKLFFEVGKYNVDSEISELNKNVGDTLLEPHTNYTRPVLSLLDNGIDVKGIAHITGGGFIDNIPRILPQSCSVEIKKGSWQVLPVFKVMQDLGNIDEAEMYRTFNMGIGMVLIVDKDDVGEVLEKTGGNEIGRVIEGKKKVKLV